MFGYSREAVRVKVKKCEGKLQPELRKFSVDPQITSLEVLQSILTKAFDIKSDFTISYKTVNDYGHEIHLPLLSDWDLDAAFLKAHNISVSQRCEPCVQLRVDMRPFAEAGEDWEPSGVCPEPRASDATPDPLLAAQTRFQGLIMNQVEKTFHLVSRALNLYEDETVTPRAPLSDAEFRSFLDPVGQIAHAPRLRETIYCGGIDPSLRKVVWKHILNVYPDGMTGKERMDYIKRKAAEYYDLRAAWKDSVKKGQVNSELTYVTSMVRKDVLRTDRHHPFYAGSDDNQNIASLFNILTTYALNHPLVSYCQGMSDLASPLLVTMGDEAHAYICLCALMGRLQPNFLLDGEAMTAKFAHLTEALQVYDPDFYNYLKSQQADDLLFCYRWLLLEMKREFAFEDALHMLEVLWASLPQKTRVKELALKEKEFNPSLVTEDGEPPPLSPLIKTPRENAYTKVCSIRRQSSAFSLANVGTNKLLTYKQMNHSLDENSTRKAVNNVLLKHAKEFQSLDDAVLRLPYLRKDKRLENRLKNEGDVDGHLHSIPPKSAPENGKHLQPNETKSLSSSTGNLMNGRIVEDEGVDETAPLSSQVRVLRDKISFHNKFFSSLDKLDGGNIGDDESNKPKARMIKNLNEFLTFATGSRVPAVKQEKLMRTQSAVENSSQFDRRPSIVLTKTSFEENDLQMGFKGSKDSKLSKKVYKLLDSETNDSSSPDDSQEYYPMTTSMTRELRLELEHLDRQVFGPLYAQRALGVGDSLSDSLSPDTKPTATSAAAASGGDCDCQISKRDGELTEISDSQVCVAEMSDMLSRPTPEIQILKNAAAKSMEDIFVWENPLHGEGRAPPAAGGPRTPDEQAELEDDGDTGEIIDELSGGKSITPIRLLRTTHSAEVAPDRLASAHSTETNVSEEGELSAPPVRSEQSEGAFKTHKFFSSMSQELENARKSCETLLNPKQAANLQSVAATINNFQKKYEILKPACNTSFIVSEPSANADAVKYTISNLPPPHVLGGGNPFLVFLCLTVLLQHRDFIMRNRMDYNELAMHFDKMVRKHNVSRVLNQARQMYAMYLKQQACKARDVST